MDNRFIRPVILVLFVIIFLLLLCFLYKIRSIIIPFILAIILAYVLLPPVEFLVARKLPLTAAILIVFLSCASFLAILAFYVLPGVFSELNKFVLEMPTHTHNLYNVLQSWQRLYHKFEIPQSFRLIIDEHILLIEEKIVNLIRDGATFLMDLFSYSLSVIILPILTYYFLKDYHLISGKICKLIPNKYREVLCELSSLINVVLRRFIYGHLTVALIVGLLTGIGLNLIGVQYAVTLGLIVGAFDIVPYFGPIIGGIIVVIFTLLQSKKLALYAAIIMILVQQIENSLISPQIISCSVGLHPLVIIFVLLLGGYLWGILGMLLTVPLTAVLRVTINYLWLNRGKLPID